MTIFAAHQRLIEIKCDCRVFYNMTKILKTITTHEIPMIPLTQTLMKIMGIPYGKNKRTKSTHERICYFLIFLCAGIWPEIQAQRTNIYTDSDKEYKTALELFDKKKYGAAMKSFLNCSETNKNPKSLVLIDAEYYAAACAIELFNKDGEWRMRKFIEEHPESNKVKWAYFYLGKSNFRKKKYDETIKYLEKVEIYDLDKDNLAELRFKRGYSYLETGNLEKSKLDLYDIKDVENKYMHPANYYYSHIAYTEKNYSTALDGFNKLVGNETFGSIAPYYIAQIYFLQGKYDQVIKTAPSLLNDSNHVQKADEINRIIGESYFNKKDYAGAIPYLLRHNPTTSQDNYQLAYAYYKGNDYTSAIPYFEKSTAKDDSLAQNAWYHLADAYLKQNLKTKARSAYHAAYHLSFDPKITEDALYSYARLCYETGYNPYNEAINSFQKYIKEYPNSGRKDEAYAYLVNCFTSTKNYQQAIRTIEKINAQDITLKMVYQRMIYFRGIEFYNNLELDSAKKYFTKAVNLNTDALIAAEAKYWMGEVYYQKREYNNALTCWKEFLLMPGAINLKEFELANYNIAYSFFMNKNYEEANIAFRKFLLSKKTDDVLKMADAQVRTADCYFIKENWASASEYYETAIALNKIDVDYALFKKAICNGLLKNYKEKINDLKMLEVNYPKSDYLTDAVYEAAEAYNVLDIDTKALEYYNKILSNYPNSNYVLSATKSIGRIYGNRKEYDKSFEYLNRVVQNYRQSRDAEDAIEMIKKLFVVRKDPEGMENWLKSIGADIKSSDLDDSYWSKAKELYSQKDCDKAMPEIEKYLSKVPNGKYVIDAHFCYAECAYNKNMFAEALTHYQQVIASPGRNEHAEIALLKASYILYKDKNYEAALPLYQKLQEIASIPQNKLSAKQGAMRSAFYLKKYDVAIDEANKVLITEKITPQQTTEARMLKARSLYETNRKDEAFNDFKYLSRNAKNESGAEAYYYMAGIQFDRKEYKDVEKTVNSLITYQYTSNDWNTRGLLLMADVYLIKGEDHNAEATLQAIIEHAGKQEFIDEARKKLQVLKDKQNSRLMPEKESEMKIEFENSESNQRLFDHPANASDTLKNVIQPK